MSSACLVSWACLVSSRLLGFGSRAWPSSRVGRWGRRGLGTVLGTGRDGDALIGTEGRAMGNSVQAWAAWGSRDALWGSRGDLTRWALWAERRRTGRPACTSRGWWRSPGSRVSVLLGANSYAYCSYTFGLALGGSLWWGRLVAFAVSWGEGAGPLLGRDQDGSVLLGGGWQRVLGLRGRGFLVRLLRGFLVRILGVGVVVGPGLGASFGVMAL